MSALMHKHGIDYCKCMQTCNLMRKGVRQMPCTLHPIMFHMGLSSAVLHDVCIQADQLTGL